MDAAVFAFVILALLVGAVIGWLYASRESAGAKQTVENLRLQLDGLLAVCLQHEMDHLEGILFIDHLSRLKREMVLKKLAKLRKEQGQKAA